MPVNVMPCYGRIAIYSKMNMVGGLSTIDLSCAVFYVNVCYVMLKLKNYSCQTLFPNLQNAAQYVNKWLYGQYLQLSN